MPRTIPHRPARYRWCRGPSRGFTLVEMLVVIVIITALAALVVPAVIVSIKKAKQARIGLEVANLAKALERYKMEMGEYPPDFSWSAIGATVTERANRAKQLIDEHLQSVYRRRDTAGDLPRLSNGNINQELLASLSPRNALAFWLRGFTSDPQYPLAPPGQDSPARTSFFDFDPGRLNTVTGEYHPSGDSTKQPYLYYNALSYTPNPPLLSNEVQNYDPSANSPQRPALPAVVWARSTNDRVCPPYRSSSNAGSPDGPFAQNDKFQVISAGLDGEFGTIRNHTTNGSWSDLSNYPEVPSGTAMNKPHRDNVSSFSEGALEDMIEE